MTTTAREETTHLADLLRREHRALGDFLVALASFDRQRRWAELEHTSLFSFLRRELRLSAGAAQYRKTAAELVQQYPEVEAALRDGRLCLSSVIEVAKVITPENAPELLPRFFGLSSRDAAFVAASMRPVENPPQRFVVTPVRPDATAQAAPTTPSASAGPLELRAPELPVAAGPDASALVAPPPSRARPTVRPLDAERARVSMTVSRRLLDKLAAAKDALSHSHLGASEEEILELGLDLILERHARRRGLVKRPRKKAATPRPPANATPPATPTTTPTPAPRSRYVPADIWRTVWERDSGRCQFRLESGEICGSTFQLELDHFPVPFALGGPTSVENTRLCCRPHQDIHARATYGNDLMNRYTRKKGERCSEPAAVYEGFCSARRRPAAISFRQSECGR